MELHEIEVFASGTHNGDRYTERDLDDIVDAFEELDFKPAVKIGHVKEKDGTPAFGWVTALKRVGQKLVANLSDVPSKIYDLVRARQLDRVSAEIYFNLERGGKTFRRALKAVALLGAEVPAVAGLAPLREAVLENSGTWVSYEYEPDDVKRRDDDADPNGVKLHQRVVERMSRTGEKSYSVALAAETREYVKAPNEVEKNYPKTGSESSNEAANRQEAGRLLDRRAKEIVAATKSDYESAFLTACKEQPSLSERYYFGRERPMRGASPWADVDNLSRARHTKDIKTEGSGT